ncbi:hypothetical protein ElyMa_003920900 [Elysia marginata]|uniref:Uncharacterized protein n=1 Tax=Elysia marginata TaxID=1093978 RepID=A0AAV4FRT6_9GAST|nr:hypothetical protein ElyMa_003920900 [Elysia marginata]
MGLKLNIQDLSKVNVVAGFSILVVCDLRKREEKGLERNMGHHCAGEQQARSNGGRYNGDIVVMLIVMKSVALALMIVNTIEADDDDEIRDDGGDTEYSNSNIHDPDFHLY